MAEINLNAINRQGSGKGNSRQLRRQGLIPAVLYGRNQEPLSLSLNPKELYKAVSTDAGLNALIHLKVSGDGGSDMDTTILVKDLQIDPLKRVYIHADFFQIRPEDEVRVSVPIILIGKSKGVKEGGILNQTRRDLEVLCQAGKIPKNIEADISEMQINDSLHMSALSLGEGVKSALHQNVTIAVCGPPAAEEEKPVVAEAVEGETPVGEAGAEAPAGEKTDAAPEAKS